MIDYELIVELFSRCCCCKARNRSGDVCSWKVPEREEIIIKLGSCLNRLKAFDDVQAQTAKEIFGKLFGSKHEMKKIAKT